MESHIVKPSQNKYWQPSFFLFLIIQAISSLNGNIYRFALVTLIVRHYHQSTIAFVAIAIFILPYILFSATAGKLINRFRHKNIIIILNICEILINVILYFSLFTGKQMAFNFNGHLV